MPPSPPLPRSHPWLVSIGFGGFAYGFHKVGSLLGFYQEFFWFQILTHLLSSAAMALILLNVGATLGLEGSALVGFVVAFGATGAIGWEVVEYLEWFPHLIWWGIDDSLLDLTMDAMGILLVLNYGVWSRKRRGSGVADAPISAPAD